MISVTILTKNSARTLKKTLDSLSNFPEVLIYDTGSTDATLSIAATYPNTKILSGTFQGFGKTHNTASSLASHDWILSLDSDEVLSPPLSAEILKLPFDPNKVYAMSRHNYFNGKWIKGCGGWYPDWVVRLYNRKETSFTEDPVHEKILTQNKTFVRLRSPLLHTPYLEISDFLSKMQLYSTLFAENKTKNGSLFKALLHGYFAFFKSYILKRGFLEGKEGFIISLYNSHTTFYKHLKRISIQS